MIHIKKSNSQVNKIVLFANKQLIRITINVEMSGKYSRISNYESIPHLVSDRVNTTPSPSITAHLMGGDAFSFNYSSPDGQWYCIFLLQLSYWAVTLYLSIPAPLLGSDTVCDINSYYIFMEDSVTWSAASHICADRGQTLINISNGIPEILMKMVNFSIDYPYNGQKRIHKARHSCMFCPPFSFWAHTALTGMMLFFFCILQWIQMHS